MIWTWTAYNILSFGKAFIHLTVVKTDVTFNSKYKVKLLTIKMCKKNKNLTGLTLSQTSPGFYVSVVEVF